jgi:hypothetical protein
MDIFPGVATRGYITGVCLQLRIDQTGDRIGEMYRRRPEVGKLVVEEELGVGLWWLSLCLEDLFTMRALWIGCQETDSEG